jgi:hypothetical protein
VPAGRDVHGKTPIGIAIRGLRGSLRWVEEEREKCDAAQEVKVVRESKFAEGAAMADKG